jgi:YesN/AraC family two-component response regulator
MPESLKILIVEDQSITARDLAEIVEDAGHSVVDIASNAEDAIWLMKLHAPDLVLSDIILKGKIDGISLGRLIREEFETAIVFITSHADQVTINRASAVRPNGYIVKPFSPDAIGAAIAVAMSNYVKEHANIDLVRLYQSQPNGLSAQNISHIDDYLDHNFDQEISISAMAEIVSLSESSFSRNFKLATGKSPYQYVVERRIEEAKRLLRNTDQSIAEIGLSVGYSNQAHFSTAFRKMLGVTPGAYRKV